MSGMTSRHVRTSLTPLTVVCYSSYSTCQTCLESIPMLEGLAAKSLFWGSVVDTNQTAVIFKQEWMDM